MRPTKMKSGDIWLIASYLNVHCLVYHQSGYVDRKEQDYLLLRVLRLKTGHLRRILQTNS